jgi:tight adherence protein C
MENISPTLLLLLDVRAALENGTSTRTGVLQFLKHRRVHFSEATSAWLLKLDQGQEVQSLLDRLHPCRRALLILLEKGIKGIPILPQLIELETEIIRSCEAELDEQIQKLPIKLLLPVLFLMFPAYLLLLLGPILVSILSQI